MSKFYKLNLLSFTILLVGYLTISGCKEEEPEAIEITITDFSNTIEENPTNGAALGNISATVNRGTISYAIKDETVVGAFNVDATTGELTVGDASLFDFEKQETLSATVVASVETEEATANVFIQLTDVAEDVTIEPFTVSIDENPMNGSLVGVLTASTDGAANLVYSLLSGDDAAAFAIESTSGELTVADSSLFDYERKQTLTATYEVSNGVDSKQSTITVNLNNLSEVIITANDFTSSVDENVAGNTVIGTVDASFTGATGTMTYSIVSQSVSSAVVINSQGQILVNDPSAFNFEARTQITGVYRASVNGESKDANFTININDLDERYIQIEDFVTSIDENKSSGVYLGRVDASIIGGQGTLLYSLTQENVPGAIRMDGSGRIYIANASDFDYEVNPIISGTYQAQIDGSNTSNATATASFTINLNDLFTYTKTVFAGQAGTFGNTNATGSAARFNEPVGMTFDDNGNLYVADKNNHRIRKIDASANVTTFAGSSSGLVNGYSAQFSFPWDVDFHPTTGDIWVADWGNSSLRYIQPDGNTLQPQNNGVGFQPVGIAIIGESVFVSTDHYIRQMSIATKTLTNYQMGTSTAGYVDGNSSVARFYSPRGMDFDANANLWVADYGNRYVRIIDTTPSVSTNPGAYFQITDVEVAPDGKIYAVEAGNQRVRIVTSAADAASEVLVSGFNRPEGIAIHPTTGEVYISDRNAHCIYKLERVEL